MLITVLVAIGCFIAGGIVTVLLITQIIGPALPTHSGTASAVSPQKLADIIDALTAFRESLSTDLLLIATELRDIADQLDPPDDTP